MSAVPGSRHSRPRWRARTGGATRCRTPRCRSRGSRCWSCSWRCSRSRSRTCRPSTLPIESNRPGPPGRATRGWLAGLRRGPWCRTAWASPDPGPGPGPVDGRTGPQIHRLSVSRGSAGVIRARQALLGRGTESRGAVGRLETLVGGAAVGSGTRTRDATAGPAGWGRPRHLRAGGLAGVRAVRGPASGRPTHSG